MKSKEEIRTEILSSFTDVAGFKYCDATDLFKYGKYPEKVDFMDRVMEEYADQFKPKWVPISEGHPGVGKQALLFGKDGIKRLGHITAEEYWWITTASGLWPKDNITHWMPLPENPI